ncbi:aspartate--tRNA ligase [Faecalitalea cylindroides]|uniref:Aspartate--tRNA ligase n=1 Tax=Faecalitalea cylindroides TaxID=39483 RepID=A0AAW6FR35_9FIRM|nr:aspartate--tRNA ligase [Faecalitalea cylindroides]MDB7952711.1 aspartate--tRNA ligase [Faecalitalea cylindroides]MDB7959738.1 aspartate--tRNA ligase [Faecalitalea cylindroides]MDB7961405.1 aspartate--tRNA ligase [Faecalitalea cylindroides]MDB7963219.1 aspartate--tRNA ligase [Faecalitalea cylindroides]MDB7965433.1 aspartate--tRNA ligase [Faecalitalea cylindroides]
MNRTHHNGDLRLENVNEHVELVGWVAKKRNFGQLVFIDLRDRSGICQLVFDESMSEALKDVRNEYVLSVSGIVLQRKDANPDLKTGEIEVKVEKFEIINKAKTTPLIIADETDALEDTRLQYRYLDLRRPVMQNKLIMRHKITRSMREYLDNNDFIEIETPMLGKSTPEGARDYLVPSRVHPGSFYALPQSPQLYKQLLMIAGFERYYQFARCFRDEDLRADRQTDFTQVDIETSFLSEVEIQTMMEEMMVKLMKEVKGIDIQAPFLRLSYEEAMNRYGSDKPDNRFGYELQDITEIFKNSEFKVFKDCIDNGGVIKTIVIDNFSSITRKEIDKYTELAKKNGAKGLVVLKAQDNELTGSARKFLSEDEVKALYDTLSLKDKDVLFIVSDQWTKTCNVLGALRNEIGYKLGLKKKDEFSFLWVTDFPMFEWSEEQQRYVACHHPFTQPKEEDIPLLDTDIAKVKANAYDIILNGYELGGGSLRIYDNDLQEKIFEILGMSEEEIRNKFGFFIDAFQYGTPPHGGLAFGLDRIAMILSESDSIRDVIAFPKNANAKCPMSKAPTPVDPAQLEELHIEIKK